MQVCNFNTKTPFTFKPLNLTSFKLNWFQYKHLKMKTHFQICYNYANEILNI